MITPHSRDEARPMRARAHTWPRSRWPLHRLLLATTAAALATTPAMAKSPAEAKVPSLAPSLAQIPAPQQQAPKNDREPALAGMPLYTSDGKMIGTVIAMGLDEDDVPVLVAEVERSLGFGPTAVAVPVDLYVRQPDRIELTITEAEVNTRLGR